MMNNFEECLKHISDIKKEMHNKNVELKQLKDRQVSLNEELEMCQTKISWLREDIEDIFCNYFSSIRRIHIDKEINCIEVEFAIASKIRLSRIEDFIDMIGKELEDCAISCDADGFLYLQINL